MVPKKILRLNLNSTHCTCNPLKFRGFFLLILSISLHSCEEDISVKYKNANKNFASQVIYNADMIERDSGRIKLLAKAPVIENYTLVDSPYTIAKKGIEISFFDKKNPSIPGKLRADCARMEEITQMYYAKGKVRILTADGKKFAMNSLTWNRKSREVYTRDTVYVNDEKGNLMIGNNGMIAKDDMSQFSFFDSHGELNANALPETAK